MKSKLEHGEQVAFINWFRATFPDVLIFAIPNGGKRAMSEAKRLKAEGVVAGVPDIFIPAWLVWIELKRERGGRVSSDQREIIGRLQDAGHTVAVCAGWRSAADFCAGFAASDRSSDGVGLGVDRLAAIVQSTRS